MIERGAFQQKGLLRSMLTQGCLLYIFECEGAGLLQHAASRGRKTRFHLVLQQETNLRLLTIFVHGSSTKEKNIFSKNGRPAAELPLGIFFCMVFVRGFVHGTRQQKHKTNGI